MTFRAIIAGLQPCRAKPASVRHTNGTSLSVSSAFVTTARRLSSPLYGTDPIKWPMKRYVELDCRVK